MPRLKPPDLPVPQRKNRRLATINQLAVLYSVSPRTIRKWISTGKLTAYVLGTRAIRIDLDEAEAMLTRRMPTAS